MRMKDTDVLLYAIDKMMDIAQQSEEDNELRELTLIPLRHIKELVTELPTVDAFEVVRCKDCKHYEEIGCLMSDPPKPIWGCHLTKQEMTDDDFCSKGERREMTKNEGYKADCRNCVHWNDCPCGKTGHEKGTSIGYSIGECQVLREGEEDEVKTYSASESEDFKLIHSEETDKAVVIKSHKDALRELLHECRNELCLKCAMYRASYSCDNCKWALGREWETL